MIYTGYYSKIKEYEQNGLTLISISGRAPEWFNGLHWKFFAPSWDIYSKWKEGIIDDNDYISRYIPERLEILDKQELINLFNSVNDPILLCYEKEGFCHRHILAKWIKENLFLDVEEWKC